MVVNFVTLRVRAWGGLILGLVVVLCTAPIVPSVAAQEQVSRQAAAQTIGRVVDLPLETDWTVNGATGASGVATGDRAGNVIDKGFIDAAEPRFLVPVNRSNATISGNHVSHGAAVSGSVNNTLGNAAPIVGVLASSQETVFVGVGDQIFITVFGQADMSAEVTVNENEQVTLSLIGTLKVGGLTPPAIEKLIAQRLKEGDYLRNPQVSVQVRQVRSQMISVLGEVARPGRFPIVGKLTVLEAIATAGGLGPRADRTVSLLRRNGVNGGGNDRQEIAIRLDHWSDATRGDLDMELKNDDVVFVAPQKMFYVHGEVRRPGAYPMEPDLNIMRVLSISGGVTERGSLRRIRIHRKIFNEKINEINPNLNTLIVPGDVVYVDERLF